MKTRPPAQAEHQLTHVADRFDHWRRQARHEIAATQDHDHLSWETDQVLHEATSLLQGFGETDGLNSKAQLMLQRHLTQETLVALSRTDFCFLKSVQKYPLGSSCFIQRSFTATTRLPSALRCPQASLPPGSRKSVATPQPPKNRT